MQIIVTGASGLIGRENNEDPFIYDIKQVKALLKEGKIYIYVEYYHNIEKLPFAIHSVDLRDRDDRQNRWFLQTWRPNMLNLRSNEEKTELALDEFDIINLKQARLFIVEARVFTTDNLEFRCRAGAYDNEGETVINSDLAGYFPL